MISDQHDLTRLGYRAVYGFRPTDGEQTPVALDCVRVGPAPRPVAPTGTRFRVTATLHDGHEVSAQAASVWAAFTAVRAGLETLGWLLPIAAARRDSYAISAARYPDATMVFVLDSPDPQASLGFLEVVDRDLVGTVAEQQAAYQAWLSARPDPAPAEAT